MKISIYTIILSSLFVNIGFSQNGSLKVTYLESRSITEAVTKAIPEHLKEQLLPVLKKEYEKQMILEINGSMSSYREDVAISDLPTTTSTSSYPTTREATPNYSKT